MKTTYYLFFIVIIFCSCHSKEEPAIKQVTKQKNIFEVNPDEFKLFEGKTINEFLSAYKEKYSQFLLLRGDNKKFFGVRFIYNNNSLLNTNTKALYIIIEIDNMQYQDPDMKENKGEAAKVQMEIISRIKPLIIPRNEFAADSIYLKSK